MKKLLLFAIVFSSMIAVSQTKLTHSSNEVVWSANSAACTTSGPGTIHNNSFIRVFDTNNFNVQDSVFFVSIELGVESTTGGAYDLIGRVYQLNGTLLFANMTLLAADTAGVYPDSGLYKMTIPMKDGFALPGDTLIAEVFAALNNLITFYPGSNPYLESDESYIAAAGCGITEPVTYASIGFSTAHLILNLWVNHKPKMNDISLSVFKDNVLDFNKSDFDVAMNDYDSDTIGMIQVLTLPLNGLIENNGSAIAIGDTIFSNELELITYTPNAGYSGNDDFDFKVRDNSHWSNDSTNLAITIFNWQVGIDETENTDFEIYPNPSSTRIEIKSTEKIANVSIYSLNGRLILSDNSINSTFDISSFSDGIYFVAVTTENGFSVQKFIKE